MSKLLFARKRTWIAFFVVAALISYARLAAAINASVTIMSPANNSTVSGAVSVQTKLGPAAWWAHLLVDGNWVANLPPNTINWYSTNVSDGVHTLVVQSFLKSSGIPVAADSVRVTVNNSSSAAYFSTVAPNQTLPSESWCAANIPVTAEKIPDNAGANSQVPSSSELSSFRAATPILAKYANQVDGNYTGSTDMIMRWAACKWGIDENVVRAQTWGESAGYQSGLNSVGDWTNNFSFCPPGSGFPGAWDGSKCGQSYGLIQIKYIYQPETWPMTTNNTAFNLDYRFAIARQCMDGADANLFGKVPNPGYPSYPNGNTDQMLWGCMGAWYNGDWYDTGALGYVTWVQLQVSEQQWLLL
jgi:hypothetical protein